MQLYLENHFILFIDYHDLIYLVNKTCAIGRIICWFVILLKFHFSIAVWLGSTHQHVDHLSCIISHEVSIGVNDDLLSSTLFMVEIAPRWTKSIIEVLSSVLWTQWVLLPKPLQHL